METARQEAEAILQQARAAADEIRATAQREGFADGQARALEELRVQHDHARCLIEQLGAAYQEFCARQVPELASLAAAVAEKLLCEQLTIEPERVLALVREALDHVIASARVTVHLHPVDLEIVRGGLALQSTGQAPSIHLNADPTVERGGCWIESEQGEVDATVAGRLARVALALGEG